MRAMSEGEESEGTTIFVRNLPFDVTNEQLEGHFGDVAPVRRAFVVTQQDGKARGFGFVQVGTQLRARMTDGVQYATSDDAKEAVKSLNGSDLQGRALKLEIAAKKGDKKVSSCGTRIWGARVPVVRMLTMCCPRTVGSALSCC